VVFGDRNPAIAKRLDGTFAVEPGRRDEAVDAPADDVFKQCTPFDDAGGSIFARQAEEFAFSRGHIFCAKSVRCGAMPRLVAMEIAVQENFRSRLGPAAKPFGEGGSGNDRSVAPMVGNDEHRHAVADVRPKEVEQPVDLTFEARRDVVDRRKQEAFGAYGHGALVR